MATKVKRSAREPLSKDRVLAAAIAMADQGGVESLSMRRLAQELDVVPMAPYKHVANKDDMLDGMVEAVVKEINDLVSEFEAPSGDWKSTVRTRVLTARGILLRHPWAPRLMETRRSVSPEMMRYYDSLIALFQEGGFSVDLTHHALHALGSRALGFTQELYDDAGELDAESAEAMMQQMAGRYPHITGMVAQITHDAGSTLGWCDDQFEFEFALDLMLDGLEKLRLSRR